MTDQTSKHYSIDAGAGRKMEGCPYSLFEDGRDVKDYIIPPKGYSFKGFECVLLPENRIYDGKLVAIYEREPFQTRILPYLKYILAAVIVIAVIGIIITLFVRPFKAKPTMSGQTPREEVAASVVDTTGRDRDSLLTEDVSADTSLLLTELEPCNEEETPAVASDIAFKQAFWALIHSRETSMDTYHALFDEYKGQGVSGVEFEYLRSTILKNWATYKEWYQKLKKIPSAELQQIESIDTLIERLNEQ